MIPLTGQFPFIVAEKWINLSEGRWAAAAARDNPVHSHQLQQHPPATLLYTLYALCNRLFIWPTQNEIANVILWLASHQYLSA